MEREGGRDVGGQKERGINSKYYTFLFLGEKLVVEGNRGKGGKEERMKEGRRVRCEESEREGKGQREEKE